MNDKKETAVQVGISMCLLGEKVRFDSGHKKDRYLTDVLGAYFQWVPVCPELEVGMGVPREAVRLVGEPESPRMVGVKSERDWTEPIQEYSDTKINYLSSMNLSGFIFKSDSPSCGMERVRIYSTKGIPSKSGRGMFAFVFMKANPLIPVEEEGRLNDLPLRENFIVRVFAYNRLQKLFESGYSRKAMVQFHTIHKYLLLAHSAKHYGQLGKLVASAPQRVTTEFRSQYSFLFMEALRIKTTVKKNTNVLQHIMGFMKDKLSSQEKNDILSIIQDYHNDLVPLIVPLTLIRHYVQKHNVEYILQQVYLNPHPKELMLRNHV